MTEQEPQNEKLYKIRHSLAHVLAQAVLQIRPGSKLGFGPPIDDGFYYDFMLNEPITDADFPEIERRMKKIIKQKQKFEYEALPVPDALARLQAAGEPLKAEYARDLAEQQKFNEIGFYRNGPFVDMCRGPHVEHTGQLPADAFKLRSLAGAYWRGDSRNPMLARIYAWAYETAEELQKHVREYEEALARDHKKLGRELDIFVIDDEIGRGLPLWLPNGTVIREELEKLGKELEFKAGYQRVATPHLAKADLYRRSGHLPYYAPHMYPLMEVRENAEDGASGHGEVKESYVLRPMNCPHHHRIFAARLRSYRDLPLRLAEFGTVYRFEDSGALSGLLRVRGMTMNDAHIYCTEDQIKSEFQGVMELHRQLYEILGLTDYHLRFSTWDPNDEKRREKYVNNPEAWERSQRYIKEAIDELELPYVVGPGEAAFYGPKIDIQFRSVTGREETASTNQLDFAQPERMGLVYTGADNQEHRPYCIHRAPLGTHERFVAFLIERWGGAFPTWLAPVQVRVMPVAERFVAYGEKLVADLRNEMVRAELDMEGGTVSKRIRNAVTHKIPNMLVVGEREELEETVTLRRYGVTEQETLGYREFKERLLRAIRERSKSI